MTRFEEVVTRENPQAVLVVGDVNSTIACALVAAKHHLPTPFTCASGTRTRPVIIHVEAGLRSFDDDMPEEVNRVLTDRISDLLFVTDPAGMENLKKEGCPDDRIHFVGNVMIDTLLAAKEKAMASTVLERLSVKEGAYGLVTLHRPSNVDDPVALKERLDTLDHIAKTVPLVFPVHPRTRARLASLGATPDPSRWTLTDPVGYLDFVKLMASARIVLSDSGGIQEETTILGVPCVTIRDNTERPVTIHEGTNILAGTTHEGILRGFTQAMALKPAGRVPKFWDGKTAGRIAKILRAYFEAE
jgi:UDP-N-acetylglucosamine 2-epimerase (non-hydrolysing)